jgi:hypothetical protein
VMCGCECQVPGDFTGTWMQSLRGMTCVLLSSDFQLSLFKFLLSHQEYFTLLIFLAGILGGILLELMMDGGCLLDIFLDLVFFMLLNDSLGRASLWNLIARWCCVIYCHELYPGILPLCL